VFSLVADVDPRIGTGGYRIDLSLCGNLGPDTDFDGLADVCDDDDDDDNFIDSLDLEPFDPLRCQDIEGDSCDDCVNGGFDPFDDGINFDGDHLCDAGDPDDDNDGCADEIDSHPFATSQDTDSDFVGSDCDNCQTDYNPGQLDTDEDGLGDVCDPTPTPEPGAGLAAGVALATLAGLRRRRRAA
jgi:MYXO-CTERM domain-containing protein